MKVFNNVPLFLYVYVYNNPINLFDPLGLEVTKEAVISYKQFLDNVKRWEKKAFGGATCMTCLDKLGAFAEQIKSNAPWNAVNKGQKKFTTGELGWQYLYTESEGWIDFGHFANTAYYSATGWYGELGTKIGGYGWEAVQFVLANIPGLSDLIPQAKNEQTSAFTREDFGSNRLGAEFGTYLKSLGDNCHSLSVALQLFLSRYGPIINRGDYTVGKVPDYKELPENQAELDSRSFAEIRRKTVENRHKYEPHGINTIFTKSKPKP